MDDIVERAYAAHQVGGDPPDAIALLSEMGAEITRLRTLLAERDHKLALLEQGPMSVISPKPAPPPDLSLPPPAPKRPSRSGAPKRPSPSDAQWGGDSFVPFSEISRPVGFTCRSCGKRVKERHTDPRLLCENCK